MSGRARSGLCAALTLWVGAGLGCARLLPFGGPAPLEPSADCFEQLVSVLASDRMAGRGIGTAGLDAAALFLAQQFQRLGLEPLGADYQQRFWVTTGVVLGASNRLHWDGHEGRLREDYTPLGFSSAGEFAGSLVFAGYGIVAEPLGYDDYAGLDVRGKVVLAMRYEPGESDEASPFEGRRPSRWSDLRYKALKAREAGAAALIFVRPPGDERSAPLPILRRLGPVSAAGIPVLQVSGEVARGWLALGGLDLDRLHASIDASYRPHSQELPFVRVDGRIDLVTTRTEVANVLGISPGRGVLAGELVVVGAHYDHLGRGGPASMAPDREEIHNGADDNASGVAAMVCGVAGLLRELEKREGSRRALVVVGFTAEEIGLGGSGWYVRHPPRPLEQTTAMVNLDMVGRLRGRKLQVLGTDSAAGWDPLLERIAEEIDVRLPRGGDGYGPSDQMSFFQKGVPVAHLFTGAHSEYHTPEDDLELLDLEGGATVSRVLQGILADLLTREQRLRYRESSSGPTMAGDSRGYGSYLGTIPDYTEMLASEGGVLLAAVRVGGPAEQAGIRGGDRIVRMAGVEVRNLYDMTFVLRDQRPGSVIEIELLRGEERRTLRAMLGRRGSAGEPRAESGHGLPTAAGPPDSWAPRAGKPADELRDPRETHLAELRQLTFGGENAEAYFSPDGRRLVFQRTPPEGGCDQQYVLDLDSGSRRRLSSGRGRTTCGYYAYPDGERLIYSTTEGLDPNCPPQPDRSQGYVWALYDYDLVWQRGVGAEPEAFLPSPGYDAEATVCMRDGRVLFTSMRNGDLDLYVAEADGSGLRQLTDTVGYDGGAFFTPDCSAIVWRASRPQGDALREYRRLLAEKRVRPSALEIFWMRSDGSERRQLTRNGRANFGPYPLPDGSAVLFSSNAGASEREFDLFLVSVDGGEPERVTFAGGFDGFPMFSPDGRWLVFASNRGGRGGETNLFIARWVP